MEYLHSVIENGEITLLTSAAERITDPDNKTQLAAGSIADMREQIGLNRPIVKNADLKGKAETVVRCIKACTRSKRLLLAPEPESALNWTCAETAQLYNYKPPQD
jgi:hypothetical protein